MQLLILQFVAPAPAGEAMPCFSHNLGVLAAQLAAEGISCSLSAMPGYRPDLLREALATHSPSCVLIDINPYSVTAAHRTIGEIAKTGRLPVVVCGQYATCRPTQAISIPGVTALLLGEYDRSGVELIKAMRDGSDVASLPGVWAHTSAGLQRNDVAPLVEDLDSLPLPDRELFNFSRIARQTGEIGIKAARACPQWCSFCVNDWYMDLYGGRGQFVRRRSVDNVLGELHGLAGHYAAATSVHFYDHCFAADRDWLAELAAGYSRRCALPYRCHVPINFVTPEVADLLAASNCRWVSTAIASGSRFIREEIFSLHAGDEQIVSAVHTLRRARLHVTAEVFVGSPYESAITVEETINLLKRCEVDDVQASVFYPTPGTRAAELCSENGWISGRGEENYWASRSVLDMPSMKATTIDALAGKFPALAGKSGNVLGRFVGKLIHSRRKTVIQL